MSKRKGNGGAMHLYRSYMFRGKDPVIDELRTKVQDANKGKLDGRILRHISDEGGPSTSAMRGWFFGATRRPNNATLEACGRSIGWKRVWVKNE